MHLPLPIPRRPRLGASALLQAALVALAWAGLFAPLGAASAEEGSPAGGASAAIELAVPALQVDACAELSERSEDAEAPPEDERVESAPPAHRADAATQRCVRRARPRACELGLERAPDAVAARGPPRV